MARILGSVALVAAAWGLDGRLARARRIGSGYGECLACTVGISRRGKTLAGKALTPERRIVINSALLIAGREADRDATFLHECAHVIADIRYRAFCRHDWRWRRVMALLGEPARAHHDIACLSPRAHAVVTWVCAHCGEEFHYVRAPRRRIEDCCCRACGPRLGRLYVKEDRPVPRAAD
ncbi:MAG: SprT-like domain-containing protein [Alphaproteobacteria bacterium]